MVVCAVGQHLPGVENPDPSYVGSGVKRFESCAEAGTRGAQRMRSGVARDSGGLSAPPASWIFRGLVSCSFPSKRFLFFPVGVFVRSALESCSKLGLLSARQFKA